MSIVKRAREFAEIHHYGKPYGPKQMFIYHLDEVAKICARYGQVAEIVAWLHDVVEDTSVSIVDILLDFDEEIMILVQICTDPEPPAGFQGASREAIRAAVKARAHAHWARVPERFWTALLVKAVDRLANVRACQDGSRFSDRMLETYKQEHAAFKAAVYRPGLCDKIWEELDALIAAGPV